MDAHRSHASDRPVARIRHWAAFPGKDTSGLLGDKANLQPENESLVPDEDRPADCFFVHPTGCFSKQYWNQHMDDEQANERSAAMMGGQASAFSIACRVFAPRYRQFSASGVYARAQLSEDVQQANSEAAYGDVKRAFWHFIHEHNVGRPFILAGHSQGSGHLQRLIAEELDTNWDTLGERFIAGYIIGGARALARQLISPPNSQLRADVLTEGRLG